MDHILKRHKNVSQKLGRSLTCQSRIVEKKIYLKCLFLLKSFVLKVTYVTHSLTELSKTGKVGNSFRFWLHCAFLWNHPVLADIFAYCYCDIETQYKLTENQSFVNIWVHSCNDANIFKTVFVCWEWSRTWECIWRSQSIGSSIYLNSFLELTRIIIRVYLIIIIIIIIIVIVFIQGAHSPQRFSVGPCKS